MSAHWELKICPICGKQFIPSPEHKLTDTRGNPVCSCHCSTVAHERRYGKKEATEREKLKRDGVKVKRKLQTDKKPVELYTKDGVLVKTYPSVSDAARDTGWSAQYVSQICRGERISRYDYTFKFANAADMNDGRKAAAKCVLQYTKDGKFVARYQTIKEAAKSVDCCVQIISDCCKGLRQTAKGYVFSFEKE